EEFYTDDSTKVFLYTRIGCEKPGLPIFHRWSVLREGLPKKGGLWEEMHSSQLWINSTNYRTWTYKTVFPGHWCVDVLAPDNKTIIKSFFFKVKGPKSGEQIDFDIQYDITQISLLESELCEKVEDNQPVNPTEVFNVAEDEWGAKVWIYMKLGCKAPPAKIYLRWNRWIKTIDGNDGWSPDVITMLAIKGESWRTRGFKTCQPGLWRLDILAPDGETIMKVFEFEVKKEQGELEQEKSET
ncbi:MAG: DUF2914 domain-containing protein, partial [Spirochaetes bacterium]|nr:DUF2914 domain-containing protein [Spirochaetota bacterium]